MKEKIDFKPGNMLYPLPVVLVSCGNKNPNIITIAWTGTVCSSPACVSISVKKERYSFDIIDKEKEFVINLPTEELTKVTDFCGVKSGKNMNKFETCNLTSYDMDKVSAKAILECPINIGCKVINQLDLGSHTMFVAEVVEVKADKKYLDQNGRYRFEDTNPICYSHGEYYALGKYLGKFGYSVKKEK